MLASGSATSWQDDLAAARAVVQIAIYSSRESEMSLERREACAAFDMSLVVACRDTNDAGKRWHQVALICDT